MVVIGAGHAGLAFSSCLSDRSIEHVVLERGEVANSWRRERWDSLRLLTPNWQSRLPGYRYNGDDPDGFMTMPEVIDFVSKYADVISAPLRTQTTVTAVRTFEEGYEVDTDGGSLRAQSVVLASGAGNIASVPSFSVEVPSSIPTMTALSYRRPEQLPDGSVLVVGASATGIQIADEVHRSGRQVVLSVGEHVRLPRTYRERDILWWMDVSGIWEERYDQIEDLNRARSLPSPQLVGTPERMTLDLNTLTDLGVELVGRWSMLRGKEALFSGGLRNQFALADLKMNRLLDTFDQWAREHGGDSEVGCPERFEPTRAPDNPRLSLNFATGEIQSIVWATGLRPNYSWLNVPVLDRKGRLIHEGGVVAAPGLYAVGLPVLRRRKSSFIHGAESDARDLTEHLGHYLAGTLPPVN